MSPTRRSFMTGAFFLVNAITGTLLAIPILGYILEPLFKRRSSQWIEAGAVDAFSGGVPKPARLKYEVTDGRQRVTKSESFWIVADSGNVIAFSSVCPHLGCTVGWKPEENHFHCPCHDGVFDAKGMVVSGPPPSPMTRMPVKLENGKIFIQV